MPKFSHNTLSENAEDYLERIQELIERQGFARVSDLAEELGLGKASVSSMIQRLARQGWVNNQRYRGFTLTKEGVARAEAIRERHAVLTDFFKILGITSKIAQKDIEGIEHHLSHETVIKLKKFIARLQKKSRPK
ncbi:MAG: MarR family transcriptional regulator [Verrucomicrobiae bacterium]|nr:MarR family transcriptional regulator [Verrucomicrobiae bacterium]